MEKIFRLETGNIPIVTTQRVFLLYSEPAKVRDVLKKVQAERQVASGGKPLGHHLVLATGSMGLMAVNRFIEEEGIWGHVTVHTLSWEFLKLDEGLWSLELPNSLKSLMFQSDLTMLKPIAKALWAVQLVLGRPGLIWAQGSLAAKAVGLMDTLRWPSDSARQQGGNGGLGCLVVISRDVDWPSALLTPVTYTALIDQVRSQHV